MITKFYTMKSQMQSVSLRLQSVKSTQVLRDIVGRQTFQQALISRPCAQAMQEAMKGAAKAMHKMNAQVGMPLTF